MLFLLTGKNIMLKKIYPLFLLTLFIFTNCAGAPEPNPADLSGVSYQSFFTSMPVEGSPLKGGLVFIGAAVKRSNPKETVQFALEDAARQVAKFYSVSGEYGVENNFGSGAFDYTHNTYTNIVYDTEGSGKHIEAFQFDADKDSFEIDNTFFIRVVYPASLPFPVKYRPVYSGADKKPDWVDNPPLEIEGYESGVGYSGRYSSIAGAYTNSVNNAVFAIIRNINAVSKSSDLLYQETGSLFGYKTSSENIVYSFGTFKNFYILDSWIDPKEKTVWTLAIASVL